MDMILGILLGESYIGIRELADLSMCVQYTNGYVKPRDQWFLTKETLDRPLQDPRGLRGYTHRVRSRTPSDQET